MRQSARQKETDAAGGVRERKGEVIECFHFKVRNHSFTLYQREK